VVLILLTVTLCKEIKWNTPILRRFEEYECLYENGFLPITKHTDNFPRLYKLRIFLKINLWKAFHHLRICKRDKWKTPFGCPQGLYQFLIMPFGPTNVVFFFERFVTFILKQLIRNGYEVCEDDIPTHIEDAFTHTKLLWEVTKLLNRTN
jgi:hypothetical protein